VKLVEAILLIPSWVIEVMASI
jgi:hypothetical protein